MSDWAIRVEKLSKLYRIGLKEQRHETLVGAAADFLRSPAKNLRQLQGLTSFTEADESSEDVIWALRDVSFEVPEGEVLGIIGANGAGKSTLLKILSGITEPTSGRALVRGRVASLLEVGTGFHQELTGRENVYLNGTILGMTKVEVDRKFDEIVDFSGVEKFIDTPVKRYSSGMKVRLAFAVAAHLEPEVLLIDEVLAVGDAEFQLRCIGRMEEVANAGRTVFFVSHNLPVVSSLCSRVAVIGSGELQFLGETSKGLSLYSETLSIAGSRSLEKQRRHRIGPYQYMKSVRLVRDEEIACEFYTGEDLNIEVVCDLHGSDIQRACLGFRIADLSGSAVIGAHMRNEGISFVVERGVLIIRATIPEIPLAPGTFTLSLFFGNQAVDYDVLFHIMSFQILENRNSDMSQRSNNFGGKLHVPVRWKRA